MDNLYRANEQLAELIKQQEWDFIRRDEEVELEGDGNFLAEHEGKRLSLLDLAKEMDAPGRVIKIFEGLGFKSTAQVRLYLEGKGSGLETGR